MAIRVAYLSGSRGVEKPPDGHVHVQLCFADTGLRWVNAYRFVSSYWVFGFACFTYRGNVGEFGVFCLFRVVFSGKYVLKIKRIQ